MEMVQKRKKNRPKKRPFPYDQDIISENKKHFTNYHQMKMDSGIPENGHYLSYNDTNIYGNGIQCFGGYYGSMPMESMHDPRSGYFFNTSCYQQMNSGYSSINYGYHYQNRFTYPYYSPHLNTSIFNKNEHDFSRDSLYITNIPLDCTELSLYNIFNFDNLIARYPMNGMPRIKVYKNEKMGASCLITFISPTAASYVKEAMDKQDFPGTFKKMKIKFAVHKKKFDNNNSSNNNNDHDSNTATPPRDNPTSPVSNVDVKEVPKVNGKNGEENNVVGGYIARFETTNDEDQNPTEEKKKDKPSSAMKKKAKTPPILEDWACLSCRILNFSGRTECYKCGCPRQSNDDNH